MKAFVRFLAIAAFLCSLAVPASAVSPAYRLKTGSTYTYEVVQKSRSEATSNAVRATHPAERTSKLDITVLAFRDGVYVLEIVCGDRRLRRYMNPTGAVVASPGEAGPMLPFFATFVDGDWQTGKPLTTNAMLPVGRESVPVRWTTTLTGLDGTKKKATISVAGDATFPADRVIKRSLSVKGSMIMNLESGCPESAEWTLAYDLSFANKEIAVIRDLWTVRESTSTTCRLTGVKP